MQANAAVDLPDLTARGAPGVRRGRATSSAVRARSSSAPSSGCPTCRGSRARAGPWAARRVRARRAAPMPRHPRTRRPARARDRQLRRPRVPRRRERAPAGARPPRRAQRLPLPDRRPGISTPRRRPPRTSRCPTGTDVDALKADAQAEAQRLADEAKAEARGRSSADGASLPTPEECSTRRSRSSTRRPTVSVGTDARVAGREVYELVLEPRDRRHARRRDLASRSTARTVRRSPRRSRPAARAIPRTRSATARCRSRRPDASVFAFAPPTARP